MCSFYFLILHHYMDMTNAGSEKAGKHTALPYFVGFFPCDDQNSQHRLTLYRGLLLFKAGEAVTAQKELLSRAFQNICLHIFSCCDRIFPEIATRIFG